MKKVLPFVLITLLIACLTLALCACGETDDPVSAPVIRSYRLNDQGHFIAVYEGGETKDLGDFSQTIAANVDAISVSLDDYYVVDGIKTSIRAHQPYAYSIDKDAHLVAHFADGTTQDLGDFERELFSALTDVRVSDKGKYVINGYHTDIPAKVAKEYKIEDGHLFAVYSDDEREDLGEIDLPQSGQPSEPQPLDPQPDDPQPVAVTSVEIAEDGYYVVNGNKTSIQAKRPTSYTVDEDRLIAHYADGTTQDLGEIELPAPEQKPVESITVSADGYYVVDGVKTNIKQVNYYTVSYAGEGVSLSSVKVQEGATLTQPSVSRTGYTLQGWYDGADKWDFARDEVNAHTTLTARWTANTYTVSFETEHGVKPADMTVTYGQNFTLPTLADDGDYAFGGWLYQNKPFESGKWSIASSITLTAKWSGVGQPYTLSYGLYEGDYYEDITTEVLQSSTLLRSTLNSILASTHVKRSYSQVYEDLETVDCYDGRLVECMYTGERMNPSHPNTYWNREHTWAKSHGFDSTTYQAYSDLHHLRATEQKINSTRGNKYFDDLSTSASSDGNGNYWTGSAFEPRDEVKGDVARIMFYMVVRYSGNPKDNYLLLELSDSASVASTSTKAGNGSSLVKAYFGILSTLIKWSFQDPVDSKELVRNERIFALQKNRNPFIDYPELVYYLYPTECERLGYHVEDLGDLIKYNLKDDEAIDRVQSLVNAINSASSSNRSAALSAAQQAYNALSYESQCFVDVYYLTMYGGSATGTSAQPVLTGTESGGGSQNAPEGTVSFGFTSLGGNTSGTLVNGDVTLAYAAKSTYGPNAYGVYVQAGKGTTCTVSGLTNVSTVVISMDSNQAAGVDGTVTVTDGKTTVSEDFSPGKTSSNTPSDYEIDVRGLDESATWTITLESGNSWRVRSISFV